MLQSLGELNSLDRIIQHTIEAIENSKTQIFDIAESARKEYKRLQQELENVRKETTEVIQGVDLAQKEDRKKRLQLMEVHRDFHRYSEEMVEKAYQEATESLSQLVRLREQEKALRRRRDELERSLKNLQKTVERAENLVSQVGVVMGFLSGNLQDFSQQIGDIQQRHQLGLGVIKAQEEERKRVAREIHDGPAQSLANVVFRVELCEKLVDVDLVRAKTELQELKVIVKDGLQEVRRIIFDLRPMALDDLGLVPALRRFVETFQEREGLRIDLTIMGKEKKLHNSLEIACFRLIQESLSNIQKHAKIKEATIKVEFASAAINIIIEDQGQGFDWDKYQKEARGKKSFGLLGMEERVKLLGGSFAVKSIPGQGTKIIIRVPREED